MNQYWFYYIGFLDLLAVGTVIPLIPQHLEGIGISPSMIGLYGSLYGAVQLFSSPIVGHLTDRYGKLHVLFICIIISSLAYAASAVVVNNILALASLRCVLGMSKHSQDLCRSSLAEQSNSKERTKCIGQYNAVSAVGIIVGPLVSGLVSEKIGLSKAVVNCLLFCSVLFLVNAVIVIRFMILPQGGREVELVKTSNISRNDQPIFAQMKEIDWEVHGYGFLSRFLLAFAVMIYRSSFVLGLKHSYPSIPQSQLGYLVSYNALIGFAVGLAMSWVFAHHYYAQDEEKLQLHAAAFISVGLFSVSCAWNIPVLMFALSVLVVGTSASRACGVTLTMKRSSVDEAGKILGLNASIISIARSASPFVAGLAQEYSYSAPPYIALLISLIGCWVFYSKVYSVPYVPNVAKDK